MTPPASVPAPLLPPADLHLRLPRAIVLRKDQPLYRFHTYGPRRYDPIHFDTSLNGRLNAPDGSYGTLYAARTRAGAFAETFLRHPGARLIDRNLIALKACAELHPRRSLRLAPLTGAGLAIFGLRADVTHCDLTPGPDPYPVPHAWSQALHGHPARYDGIAYRSRHDDGEICYALFNRCAPDLALGTHDTDLDQDWFWQLMDHYQRGPTP